MSDYGRGPGPRPWHSDDPLYGDQGWDPGQVSASGLDPYGPYDPYADGAPQQQYPHDYAQYPQQQQPYIPPQAPQAPHWDTQAGAYAGPQGFGGWETTHPGPDPYGNGPADPYGHQPVDPYAAQPVSYAPQAGYAPQQPRVPRQPTLDETAEWQVHPVAEPGPFDEPDEPETHPFFTDAPDRDGRSGDYDDDPDDRDRHGKKKRRSGCAVLAAVVILGGLIGGGGYVGYRYYENHIAAAPDYTGQGNGSVQVDIPAGATLSQMGNILKQDGVVKSVDAFTAAANGANIQGGSYTLHQQMSAADAVAMMTDPSSQNALVIPEGWRATQVYDALDKYLGLPPGSSADAAKGPGLGLPSYADGNPEGFLFPSRYSVGKSSKPGDVLAQMVRQADAEYGRDNLEAQARAVGKSPYEVIVIASLIQAEAKEPQDFGKVSRVIDNRLQQQMALGFDSTINYAKGRSTLHTTTADTRYPSPYNTYLHKGLPPGPIDNPGHEAIEAALNPTPGDWLYFVTVKPGDTRFTASAAVQQQNVQAFNQYQQEHGGQ